MKYSDTDAWWPQPDPRALEWHYGELPSVDSVPWNACFLVCDEVRGYVGIVLPNGDALNPLRWADSSFHPLWGIDAPRGWWARLVPFTWRPEARPADVKLWNEAR